ncbi:FMN-binding protein [Alloscardovia venturai]
MSNSVLVNTQVSTRVSMSEKTRPAEATIGVKAGALAAVTVLATGTLLAGCGSQSAPAAGNNTDLQSNSTQSDTSTHDKDSSSAPSNTMKFPAASQDTGTYKDGTYHVTGGYGINAKNQLSVDLTVSDGKISDVRVEPETDNAISKKYGEKFVQQIRSEVVGKDLKGMNVDIVAGASWTTQAFNQALTNIRGEAAATTETSGQ